VAATVRVLRRSVAVAGVGVALCGVALGGIGGAVAWAHSPTDFLKVPVARPATVLLPPMSALPGRMQVAIDAPAGYRLTEVSAGPGWVSRVAANAAVLDGRGEAGTSVLVTVTGVAAHVGSFPLNVRLSSTAAPTESYRWRVTALAGYARPVASDVGAARPDAPVTESSSPGPRWWPLSLACALAGVALLVVRRPRRAITAMSFVRR